MATITKFQCGLSGKGNRIAKIIKGGTILKCLWDDRDRRQKSKCQLET
ncbi:MAG: hypothetical protein LBT09_02430 [Planctomycetaceae bacterium]|nr:hypothetical protein [Planctomycetaceae bacterium]